MQVPEPKKHKRKRKFITNAASLHPMKIPLHCVNIALTKQEMEESILKQLYHLENSVKKVNLLSTIFFTGALTNCN